jgi:hypothetical protein
MARQPAGGCVFCGRGRLTKSHIWPEWAQKVTPPTAPSYELTIGAPMTTFAHNIPGPTYFRMVRPGSAAKRQPRNTCIVCNGGWMREIEEAAKPTVTRLMRGERFVLTVLDQRLLAALLCLVAIRMELSGQMRSSPPSEREHLQQHREPGPRWWIAILKYDDDEPHEFWSAHMGMYRARLDDPIHIGPEHCNTQVTTMVAGKMCAHIFFSTAWDGFRGYEGAHLTQIWPLRQLDVDTEFLHSLDNARLPVLHEAIARDATAHPKLKE